MGSCCGKREGSTLETKNGDTKQLANPQTNDIALAIKQTTTFLEQNPLSRVAVIVLPKDQLKGFVAALPKLMTFIKNKTNRIFVPTTIINSPTNPNNEVMIFMRPRDLIDKCLFDLENTDNEDVIGKRYTVRAFQFISNKPQMRIEQMKTDLLNLYSTESLVIVGGVQDKNKANNMQLLLYRQETKTPTAGAYTIQIEAYDSQRSKDEYENDLNQIQLQRNEGFRCCLTFEESYRTQFLVFQALPSDNLYCIYKFPTVVHEMHQQFVKMWGKPQTNMYQTGTVEADRENILREIEKFMNNEENQMQNCGISVITNQNFDDSFLIFNTY